MNPKVKKYLNEETISDEELNLIMQINKIRIENKITCKKNRNKST